MSLLNTYTDEEKAALKEYRLPHEWHSMSSDHFVLGYRCNKALTEHLRLKEEECKQLQHDKAELLKALEVSTRAWDQYFKNGEMFDYDEYESHEKLLESMK